MSQKIIYPLLAAIIVVAGGSLIVPRITESFEDTPKPPPEANVSGPVFVNEEPQYKTGPLGVAISERPNAGSNQNYAIRVGNKKIGGVSKPQAPKDVVTLEYLQNNFSGGGNGPGSVPSLDVVLNKGNTSGGTQIDMQNTKIVNVAPPTNPKDVATKEYVDAQSGGGNLSGTGGGYPVSLSQDQTAPLGPGCEPGYKMTDTVKDAPSLDGITGASDFGRTSSIVYCIPGERKTNQLYLYKAGPNGGKGELLMEHWIKRVKIGYTGEAPGNFRFSIGESKAALSDRCREKGMRLPRKKELLTIFGFNSDRAKGGQFVRKDVPRNTLLLNGIVNSAIISPTEEAVNDNDPSTMLSEFIYVDGPNAQKEVIFEDGLTEDKYYFCVRGVGFGDSVGS